MTNYYVVNTLPTTTNVQPRAGIIKIESNIMKYKQALIIANWIEKKDANFTRIDSSSKILGAFNPIGFEDNDIGQWYNTPHSFYFSFDNEFDLQNMRISCVKTSCAFHEYRNCGLNFGNSFRVVYQILKIHKTKHYENDLNSTGIYQIKEMEVLSFNMRRVNNLDSNKAPD
ncbi:4515_t:CDS:2 [Funneliformis mosseae]|uniref:4515_t:CDS:1 n=1 Tax=Funneliformis mosseae TaxID=27381 RepID=A0A9N8VEC5_FUNMO|nr:4515_t:CDS:2 [Funneliformis mosseae]